MGKRSIVVIAILGALFLGATAWTGNQVQQTYTQLHASLPSQPALRFGELNYERGLFSAHAWRDLDLHFHTLDADGAPDVRVQTLRLVETLRHGPLAGGPRLAAVHVTTALHAVDAQGAAADVPLVEASTTVGYRGGYHGRLRSEPRDDAATLQLHGLDGRYAGNLRDHSLQYRVALDQLRTPVAGEADTRIEVQGLLLEADGHLLPDSWTSTGQASLKVARVAIDELAVEEVVIDADTRVQGELLEATGSFSGGFMTLDGAHRGDFSMDLRMANLHHGELQALAVAHQGMPPELLADPMAQLEYLDAPLRRLLAHDPVYTLENVRLTLDDRTAELDLRIASEGSAEAPALFPLPMVLVQHGQLQASGRLPADWVMLAMLAPRGAGARPAASPADIDAQLNALAQAGFIDIDDGHIASRIDYANGRLRVNGRDFPPVMP